ncbi:MAG: hypothetical protein LBB88_10390 [Planctomycetaceae bacterium]|jgi:chromosome segregation ATPase|nr:hypothetical protein [Planctomycetaceae bacterium]
MTLAEIFNKYENKTIDDKVLDLIDAMLSWASQPLQPRPNRVEQISVTINNPFEEKPKRLVKNIETEYTPSLLAESLDLMTLTFKTSDADKNTQNEIIQHAAALAEKLRNIATNKIASLQIDIQESKRLVELLEQQQNDFLAAHNTKKEREELLTQKRNKLAELKTHIKSIDNEINEIEKETNIIKLQEQNLIQNKKSLAEKKKQITIDETNLTKEKEILEKKSDELEKIKNNIQIHKNQQLELETKIEQTKKKLQFTMQIIEQLQHNQFINPTINEKIQEIWQTLPTDKVDLS